jgi:SAM-dependent methyltransferase
MIKSAFKLALNTIPRPLLIRLSYAAAPLLALFYRGEKFVDPIDGRKYRKLLPYGYKGRQRENALAPASLSLERHRLLWLYLKTRTEFFSTPKYLLHIAPEQCFYGRFRKMSNLQYLTADLDSPIADVKMDIHNIQYDENTFDVIFCNHVLEHVDDDQQCMRELQRVMKPGGMAIMQVPFEKGRAETDEDPSITDPEERIRRFGQYDHVRVYGRDYANRLKEAGFKVEIIDFSQELEEAEYKKYALMPGELLYVCSK